MNSRLDAPMRHASPSVAALDQRLTMPEISAVSRIARIRLLLVAPCLFAAAFVPARVMAAPDPAAPTAVKQEFKEQPVKPAVIVSAEENLGKVYLKLPSRKLTEGSNGDADGLLRAVPWRSIGESAVSTPQVRFSFGAEFKRGSTVAAAMAKAGEAEPFFVEQRVVQATARFEKPPENIKYRAVSAGYGEFRFRKMEDGKVEMFAYVASVGEIWAPVELPALKKLTAGLIEQLEAFGKSPQTIFLK
jgi:hypothetical protein